MYLVTSTFSELTREKEWDNIVACHRNVPFATTWSFDKAKMGEYKLLHKRFKENAKNVVALVSICFIWRISLMVLFSVSISAHVEILS